jgi:hypothetical protein
MPFSYYQRLSAANKRIYRRSDELTQVPLPAPEKLRPMAERAEELLADDRQHALQTACQRLVTEINEQLGAPAATVRVLAARPSKTWGELHGLYEPPEGGRPARLTVWMRTAQRKQVVAFKTFLRTLLHELGHHLDYEHFRLADSFHTEGFFKRESHLFKQIAG